MKPKDIQHFSTEIIAEETKRDRMWDPVQRWRAIQDTITWAEQQPASGGRNVPANRLAEQNRKTREWPGS